MKLKPCPFCGGEARWANDDENWIECSYCGVETRFFDDTQEAIKAWNRREPMERIIQRLTKEEAKWVDAHNISMAMTYGNVIRIVKKGGAV